MWIKIQDKLFNLDNVFGIGKDMHTYDRHDLSPDYYIRFYYVDDSLSNTYIRYNSEADRDRDFDYIVSFLNSKSIYRDIDAWAK